MAKLRPVSHQDELSLVEHLDELRSRLFVAGAALVPALALCGWQNGRIIELLNRPLPRGQEPITLSPTEPFLTTATLVVYAALLLALPVILYQAYAFVLPAFSPTERRVALPLMLAAPILFVAGVLFAYFVVLPPAITVLLGFNADEFNTQLRAREYYSFASLTLISLGILFQVPIGVLAATRLGVVTPDQLRGGRRYAILGIAVLAALLPTIDPVTMILEMLPLIVLYEASILVARAFGGPPHETAERSAQLEGS
ncbi:MAG: twin-arginine translocase subunit TatC [Thermoleophilaceae bacterium]|jgi:sec-independent protein translocase protein TatC|nr:twin-arginine translocase subunit TatC [Thermoleophilaceae bacterium]